VELEVNQQDNLQESIDEATKKKKKGWLSKFGVIGALLVATKLGKIAVIAKMLFAALKASKFAATFISMAITIAIYAQFYGWLFALGFVVAIFIHESGHVVASKQVGLDVSAPMFIPFLGAFITLKEQPVISKNPGATLRDIGDGVACVEFHTKMNALEEDIFDILNEALDRTETDFDGLVVGNEADNFSAGANIFMVVMAAQWEYQVVRG